MSMSYAKQFTQVAQQSFLNEVAACCFQVAVLAYTSAANPNATVQAKRLELAHAIVLNPLSYVEPFAWLIVGDANVNTPDDLTDSVLLASVEKWFDGVASVVMP